MVKVGNAANDQELEASMAQWLCHSPYDPGVVCSILEYSSYEMDA